MCVCTCVCEGERERVCVCVCVCVCTDWSVEGGVDVVRERDDCCGLH